MQRKVTKQDALPTIDIDLARKAIRHVKEMLDGYPSDDHAFVHGSDSVYVDSGLPEPSKRLLTATLACEIIKKLEIEQLSLRDAAMLTETEVGDLARIRNVKQKRFTIDHLMTILYRLNLEAHVSMTVAPRHSHFVRRQKSISNPLRASTQAIT